MSNKGATTGVGTYFTVLTEVVVVGLYTGGCRGGEGGFNIDFWQLLEGTKFGGTTNGTELSSGSSQTTFEVQVTLFGGEGLLVGDVSWVLGAIFGLVGETDFPGEGKEA